MKPKELTDEQRAKMRADRLKWAAFNAHPVQESHRSPMEGTRERYLREGRIRVAKPEYQGPLKKGDRVFIDLKAPLERSRTKSARVFGTVVKAPFGDNYVHWVPTRFDEPQLGNVEVFAPLIQKVVH